MKSTKSKIAVLDGALKATPFMDCYLHAERARLPKTMTETEASSPGSETSPQTQTLEPELFESAMRKKVLKKGVEKMALAFHQHICALPDFKKEAICRDEISIVFEKYLEKETTIPFTRKEKRSLEVMVIMRLRQKKLLKSKRYGDKCLVVFADSDGKLPDLKEQKDAREQVFKLTRELQENKNGVTISDPSLDSAVNIGELQQITLAVHSENENCLLEAVELKGRHRRDFLLVPVPNLPVKLDKELNTTLTVTPSRIGLFRAEVHFRFCLPDEQKHFSIVRFFNIKCGDKEMEKLLQPKTPYKRQKIRPYERPPTEWIDPPESKSDGRVNPFKKLPQYRIPTEVKDMVISGELENILEKPTETAGYGEFWQNILWASEFQASRDIKLFDMEDVQLIKEGRYLKLVVPGLAESRPSVLRGDLVKVTWNRKLYLGRVVSTRLLEVLLEFHKSFHHQYHPSIDRVNVGFTFSRMTFRTSHVGCLGAERTMGKTMLMPDIGDEQTIQSRRVDRHVSDFRWANMNLNDEQKTAIRQIVVGQLRPLPYIIFGPPGTGKTTTVVETVYQLARLGLKILLVAPSNDAADILVERLMPYFPPTEMRRILAYSRSIDTVPSSIHRYVEEKVSNDAQLKEILSARIVVSTINLSARFSFLGVPTGHFDVFCVDEAGHATEPEVISAAASLMDFSQGQMILAGDPKQLGPIITSDVCRKFGMDVSYLERLASLSLYHRRDGKYPSGLLTKLTRNYRSHPSILKLPNEMFYDGELECCGDQLMTHSMAKWEYLPSKGFPVLFHAIQGENLREGNSPSWFNPQEVQQVVSYAKLLMKESRPPLSSDEIGIITPYQRQAQKIRLALGTQDIKDIKVGSVEAFQGQERRCIIVSTVRAETEHVSSDLRYNLGFVANEKRFNVALTRAKTLLIVVGCPEVLALDKDNWLPFLRYCHENKSWAGDEWDPAEDLEGAEVSIEQEDSWEFVEGDASQSVLQEAAPFILQREE